jgi:hypothetical protein
MKNSMQNVEHRNMTCNLFTSLLLLLLLLLLQTSQMFNSQFQYVCLFQLAAIGATRQ